MHIPFYSKGFLLFICQLPLISDTIKKSHFKIFIFLGTGSLEKDSCEDAGLLPVSHHLLLGSDFTLEDCLTFYKYRKDKHCFLP